MKRFYLSFLIIIALGFFLRIYQVTAVPPGLTWDEAALGYNAYSLMLTGRDEYGAILPLNLKSFGDYKPALYAYTAIPFVAIFGLTELAVRFPSILAGTFFIVLIFLLLQELFKNKWLSLSGALFAAISPLSIHFSRGGWESNMATVLNLAGVYLFVVALGKKKYWFFLSGLIFGLSLITYQASRLFVPMLVLGLIILYRDQIKILSKSFLAGIGMLGVTGLLVGTLLFSGQGDRLSTTSFFAYTRSTEQINLVSAEDNLDQQSAQFQLLHGEWFAYVRGLVERYVIYFSPKMLFVDGDYSPRHKIPDMGVLPYYSLLLVLLGFYFLVKQKSKSSVVILLYLALAPLPGVLSRDLINMVRNLNLLIPFTILEAAGFYFLWKSLSRKKAGIIIALGVVGVMIFNYGMYLDAYFVHQPVTYSQGYLYGYKQSLALADISNNAMTANYDKIVMTDTYGQPYIYYLFYSRYSPAKYQQQAQLVQNSVDVGSVKQIDNIEFRHIYWPGDRGMKNSLFIGTKEELPDQDVKPFSEFRLIGDVDFKDGLNAFRVVETAK